MLIITNNKEDEFMEELLRKNIIKSLALGLVLSAGIVTKVNAKGSFINII